ncbi:hypothetical protein RM530_01895 [Algiphilus sp. W345]|uniref:Uncharacterized protein n=1 Tax=Banduia mediterranea TaxID=3075609 RepID=A0ABU2WF22_9GAMM|nr:hypothetical protein [Algiphilus sp. W345]MDT0496120.1 hypothetical protein [Algiphilus sp. W345]
MPQKTMPRKTSPQEMVATARLLRQQVKVRRINVKDVEAARNEGRK